MLEKALGFRPDAFIPDMEDSVPEAEKENARNTIAAFLPKLAESGIAVIPRVNSLDTGLAADDLAAVVVHPALRRLPVELPNKQFANIPAPPAETPWRSDVYGAVPALGQHDESLRAEFAKAI